MKPTQQTKKSKLSLNKQTIAALDANNMNQLRAGQGQAQATFTLTLLECYLTVSMVISCFFCDNQQ